MKYLLKSNQRLLKPLRVSNSLKSFLNASQTMSTILTYYDNQVRVMRKEKMIKIDKKKNFTYQVVTLSTTKILVILRTKE